MTDAVIVSAVRTAVGKAPRGTLSVVRPDELGAAAIKGALDRVPALAPDELRAVVRKISRAVVRLNTLVENVLDAGSIRAGRFTVHLGRVDLSEVVEIAVATIARWESGAHMLSSVAVHTDHRGRGLGRQLARDALFIGRHNDIGHVSLAVRHSNAAAIAAYRRAGYACIGEYATYRPRPVQVEVRSLADIDPPNAT